MTEEKFVSFIIPALNAEDTLARCLEAIQSVDYPQNRIEVIVADNGSEDKTVEIAGKFTDKVFSDADGTIAKLRNIGAKNADGEFLVFVDADCIISKEWLKVALEYFKDNRVGLVGSRTCKLPENATWVDKAWKAHLDKADDKKGITWVISRSMVVRKNIFMELGGFDESLVTCEDVDFSYRVKKKYRIISNDKLAPLHLGITNTLLGFYKKEVWRGRGNLRVGLKHIREPVEIISLATLFYYFILFILLVPALGIALFAINSLYLVLALSGIIFPIAILSLDTSRKIKNYNYFWQLFILYGIYILARISAIFKWTKK